MKSIFALSLCFLLTACLNKDPEELVTCNQLAKVPVLELEVELNQPLGHDYNLYLDGNQINTNCDIFDDHYCLSGLEIFGNFTTFHVRLPSFSEPLDVRLTRGNPEMIAIDERDLAITSREIKEENGCYDYTEYSLRVRE